MPPTGRFDPPKDVPPVEPVKVEKVIKHVKPEVCIACGGRGRSSNNSECRPCEGTGEKNGKRKITPRESRNKIVKPEPKTADNLFD